MNKKYAIVCGSKNFMMSALSPEYVEDLRRLILCLPKTSTYSGESANIMQASDGAYH